MRELIHLHRLPHALGALMSRAVLQSSIAASRSQVSAAMLPLPPPLPEEADENGVLLYYAYAELGLDGRATMSEWYEQACSELRGRVRVALDGVNATLGGSMSVLRMHAEALQRHPLLASCCIDFKLEASVSLNSAVAQEAKFDSLHVRQVAEVVTFHANAATVAPLSHVAETLSPAQFHKELVAAENTVVVDVRNVYETRVGSFAGALCPGTRAFSEFPSWAQHSASKLAGKRILIACTGGVRCERAGAFLRHLGPETANVAMLGGGIVRYLEAYPDGGQFQGSNFVFDERGVVPSGGGVVVGRCRSCAQPQGDYGARARCPACRLLILLCPGCVAESMAPLCELCEPAASLEIKS
jgi:predicted sulfurtransferase